MSLRRCILPRIHFSKFSLTVSTPKNNFSNGTRPRETMRLRHVNASTSNTPTTETGPSSSVHKLYAYTDGSENKMDIPTRQAKVAFGGSTEVWSPQALKKTLKSKNPTHIERVARDVLQCHAKGLVKSSSKPIWDPLVRDRVLRRLTLPTLEAILSAIQPRLVPLSTVAVTNLIQRLLYLEQSQDIRCLLSLVQPHILHSLQHISRRNPHSVSYTPPAIVRSAFLFLNSLLSIDQQGAISVFQALVDSDHIPSEAMIDSSSSQTLEQIISISLVKASLYWNWNDSFGDILSQLLQSTPTPDSFTLRHATACLYTLLISPSSNDLHRCVDIIRLLHKHAPVPDGLLRQFYDCAVEVDDAEVAEKMYAFSREPTVISVHSYPAPQGRALTWLMTHVAEKSKKEYLVRTLASDVVQGDLPIPVHHRAQFISTVAEKGLPSSARALWERYATGKDGSIVCGNSRVMLRMTSLFTSLARTTESKLDTLDDSISNTTETQKVSDLRSFVDHIITKYKEQHEPWEDADHRAITSYARACFIVGKKAEGFNIFKIFLGRSELPDLYDINVALGAIAKQSPESAMKMLERMEESDVKPDAVTLGTVLHYASVQKNTTMVEELVRRTIAMKGVTSDVKAFGALVRAIVQQDEEDTRETRILKLQGAWELVREFAERGTQTSTQIGNYLLSLALEAKDGRLAFKFWNALLREGAEYDDEHQRWQRITIERLILAQNMRGEISGTHARMIINQLNKRG